MKHADVRLHFSTVVQSIETQDRRSENRKVAVRTTRGSFDFDEVVVTVPLGCLKLGTPKFSPELPPNINRAISGASIVSWRRSILLFLWQFGKTLR